MTIHFSRTSLFTGIFLVLGLGCAEPPSAPEQYQELMTVFFEEMDAEDPSALNEAVLELDEWLADSANLGTTLEGFLLGGTLSDSVVNALDSKERSASNVVGMSFTVKSPHHVEDLTKTLAWVDFSEALPHLELYERKFIPEGTDPTCLNKGTCDFLEAETRVRSNWGGLGMMETRERVQFRMLRTDIGPVLLHRTWMLEKAKLDNAVLDVTIRESFKIGINLLTGGADGAGLPSGIARVAGGLNGGGAGEMEALEQLLCGAGTLRVEARWMNATFSALSDEDALDISMSTAKKDATNLDAFISNRFGEIAPPTALLFADETGCKAPEEEASGQETSEQPELTESAFPCPDEEDPCAVDVSTAEESAMLFQAVAVTSEAKPGQGFNLDPEAGEDDCSPSTACSDGIDHNLTLLGPIVNTGLENAIADNNLILLAQWTSDGGESGEGEFQLYTGIQQDQECTPETEVCPYTASIASWNCACELRTSVSGSIQEGQLVAGGDDAVFELQIPIDTALLPLTLRRARIGGAWDGENGALREGLLGGAIRRTELIQSIQDVPLETIGGISKDGVIAVVESITPDIDTDGDGENDAYSIGLSFETGPIVLVPPDGD